MFGVLAAADHLQVTVVVQQCSDVTDQGIFPAPI